MRPLAPLGAPLKRSSSTPDTLKAMLASRSAPASSADPSPTSFSPSKPSPTKLEVELGGAEMMEVRGGGSRHASLATVYLITVYVGKRVKLTVRRRYSEFYALKQTLDARFPQLGHAAAEAAATTTPDELARGFPPFPSKGLLIKGTDPAVVVRRVRGLDRWLRAVVEVLQCVDNDLVRFLCVPVYVALRVMSGDYCEDEYAETRASPVVALDSAASTDTSVSFSSGSISISSSRSGSLDLRDLTRSRDGSPDSVLLAMEGLATRDEVYSRSPQTDRPYLSRLGGQLRASVSKPGYAESSALAARAIAWHAVRWAPHPCARGAPPPPVVPASPRRRISTPGPTRPFATPPPPTASPPPPHPPVSQRAADLEPSPTLDEASRWIHEVCLRAFFKPTSLVCSVVYM